jgi:CxxC-x17-CxxC domain-containing protein
MFDVVCSECGNDCKVPFKPSTDKPIYCDNCFASKKNDRPERSESRGDRFEKPAYVSRPRNEGGASNNEDMKKQFAELNAKIDRLVNLFEKSVETKTVKAETVSAPAEKVSEEKPKKAKATKKVSKKK